MRLHNWAFGDPSMFERVFANLIDQQFLVAGLVDEIRIHLIDVLLRGGWWLFDELRSESSWNRPGSARPAARRISSTASSGNARAISRSRTEAGG
jgi:dihydrofolate reductase